ncbi:MAG: glycosyltransferase family 4 protein [Patescibacteria group bacterium]
MSVQSKKIALVYDAVFPFIKGGAEKRFYEIGRRLAKEGHDVHLYGMKCWDGPTIMKFEGMTLHGICKAMPLYTDSGRRSMLQAVWFGVNCLKLWSEKFDIIDCCGFPYFSLFSCRLVTWVKRKPLYTTWHEVWGKEYWREYLGKLGLVGYWVEKITVTLPDVIISVSNHTTIGLRETLGRSKNVVTVPNGVDIDAIQNSAPSSRASDIIFAGRLLQNKNVDVLIRAVGILVQKNINLSLFVVGEGPEKEKLQKLTHELELENNVSFFGFLQDPSELYGLMKSSKILVLPSTREGFGIIVIEANACGLPVLTINHERNAAKDLIHEGVNGLLAELNSESVAEKILQIFKTIDTLNPKQGIGEYDWASVAQNYKRALE